MRHNRLYEVKIIFSLEDKGFIAWNPELPTVTTFGETRQLALEELERIMPEVIKISEEACKNAP